MTDPHPPEQDDLTADDDKVRQTDNGWHEGDGPQPAQTSAAPDGSPTGDQ